MSDSFFFTQELEYPTSSSSSCESSESENSLPDISSLKPYDFEPEIPYAEEEQTPESEQSILASRIGNIHWCLCGECKPMETEAESLCCLDTNEVPDEHFEGKYFLYEIGYNIIGYIKMKSEKYFFLNHIICLLYTSPSPRDKRQSRMPSSA